VHLLQQQQQQQQQQQGLRQSWQQVRVCLEACALYLLPVAHLLGVSMHQCTCYKSSRSSRVSRTRLASCKMQHRVLHLLPVAHLLRVSVHQCTCYSSSSRSSRVFRSGVHLA
jgi:hypothetical protein